VRTLGLLALVPIGILVWIEHTLVWGIQGGRCGPVLEAIGVCVVEQAGTLKVRLPDPPGTPSFPALGSFPLGPLFSFPPFSFDP